MNPYPSAEEVQQQMRHFLNYNPESGVFTARVSIHKRREGQEVGTKHHHGYLKVYISGVRYMAHRLAFLWVYGRWPDVCVDHINGQRSDNRIANLREATAAQNIRNQGSHKDSRTGIKGVTRKPNGKWAAQIGYGGKNRFLGTFSTPEAAQRAYETAARQHHGEFVRIK